MRIARLSYVLIVAALLAGVLPAAKASAGSPFYLTAERSFSSSEMPELRLDYSSNSPPMLLRVLRPKSLERFLDGQLNISRSYEEPSSELNPGHYLVAGLNKVGSPLRAFRGMLDVHFRRTFKDTPVQGSILPTTDGNLASPPEEVVLEAPAGFALVRDVYLDLQFGGTSADDLGWWFGESTYITDAYKIRKVALDPLPDGVYLVQAVQGKTEAQCLIQVSSLAVQVKQSSGQMVVRVIGRGLDPVPGATVSYRDGRGTWVALPEKTDASGEVFFSNPDGMLDTKLVVKAETGDGRLALTDTDFLPSFTKDDSVFIVTDRPIFKPGENFSYKGVVRAFDEGELKVPDLARKEARISLMRTDGTATDLGATVPVTDFGSFSGSFDLDEMQTPGLYRLIAEVEGKPYGGEFRVRDYVKPAFYLDLIERSPVVLPGEPFFVKFRAKRYSGGVPKGLKYEVFLYRKKFEAPQWVIEAGGGLGAGPDYSGEIRSASALTEPKRVFSSVEARLAELNQKQATNAWDTAPKMDESGEARFEFDIPKVDSGGNEEWTYTLLVRALDQAGSQAVLSENIFMTISEAQPVVRFSAPAARIGEKGIDLSVRSTYPDGKPAPKCSGTIDLTLEQAGAGTGGGAGAGGTGANAAVKMPFTTDEKGIGRVPLPEPAQRGRLTAVATMELLDGKPLKHPSRSQSAILIIGGDGGEAVVDNRDLELYTSSTLLGPGDKAKVLALLPAGWGKAENGTVWETMAGRKVFDTRSTAYKGRSLWFEVEARPEYGTGFYHTVTVPVSGGKYREQTLGFRIVPKNKLLAVAIRPEKGETEPLKPFRIDLEVKDAAGAPSPDTELAVTVVDRAVYAVQGEIRPGVFDFFYPLPRLNLATFYSDELQGYGFADVLKKPNFSLGALKSQSKPAKKSMRDTAGWFPHVVTGADGRAAITVDMPANVTEWLVTAIATDKSGRVGESREKFRSVSDVSIEVLGPQFLRDGDQASLQIKTVNHMQESVPVQSRIELLGDAAVAGGKLQEEFTVAGLGENLSPLRIGARAGKGAVGLKVALDAEGKARVGGAEVFEIPLMPAAMKQVFSSEQRENILVTQVPEAARVSELKVQVSSGLLGAALNAAAVLVSYPYGCTEQLVHSTIPNLVLMDLVKRAGIPKEDLGPLAGILSRAEKNASAGIRKIIQSQKTDGGFGLWPSDPNPSVAVTLTAAYALKFAEELKIEDAARAHGRSAEWLAKKVRNNEIGTDKGSGLSGYELSRAAEADVYDQPWEDQIAFVENVRSNADAPLQDVIDALRIFNGFKDQESNRFNQKFEDIPVKEELIERLKKSLSEFDPEAYVKAVKADEQLYRNLGFGFGVPGIVSAGMGILDGFDALPEDLERKLKQMLLAAMKNGYWISTFDTAQVIFNTRGILSKEAAAWAGERQEKARTVAVLGKDGMKLGELSRMPSGFMGIIENPGTSGVVSEIRLDGLEPDDTAYGTITAEVPFGSVAADSHGVSVERKLMRITPQGTEPLDLSRPLRKGDLIGSQVLVRRSALSDTHAIPSEYVVVEDGIPSLAQAIYEDETFLADASVQPRSDDYWGSVKETQRYPDRTVRIARVLRTGEIKIYQVWQAAFPGKATIPPARAFDMYDESLRGNTEALSVQVE